MNVGSLFSGIGGFDLGLERAGFTTSWFCEQDPYCQQVLAEHWPDVPCYPDVSELRGDAVEAVDVLCGGFPCQDISVAGRGEGLSGARSGLWSEFARLIAELRPRYVLVENVPALRRRGLETVLTDLLACGYDAEWDGIPARALGAHHERDRIWLVAYPSSEPSRLAEPRDRRQGRESADSRQPEVVRQGHRTRGAEGSLARSHAGTLADPNGFVGVSRRPGDAEQGARGRDSRRGGVGAHELAHADDERRSQGSGSQPRPAGRGRPAYSSCLDGAWPPEPDVGRVAHGVPDRVDRLAALGNALVPQIAEWLGHRINEFEAGR